jgi:hypothetical protein
MASAGHVILAVYLVQEQQIQIVMIVILDFCKIKNNNKKK